MVNFEFSNKVFNTNGDETNVYRTTKTVNVKKDEIDDIKRLSDKVLNIKVDEAKVEKANTSFGCKLKTPELKKEGVSEWYSESESELNWETNYKVTSQPIVRKKFEHDPVVKLAQKYIYEKHCKECEPLPELESPVKDTKTLKEIIQTYNKFSGVSETETYEDGLLSPPSPWKKEKRSVVKKIICHYVYVTDMGAAESTINFYKKLHRKLENDLPSDVRMMYIPTTNSDTRIEIMDL